MKPLELIAFLELFIFEQKLSSNVLILKCRKCDPKRTRACSILKGVYQISIVHCLMVLIT